MVWEYVETARLRGSREDYRVGSFQRDEWIGLRIRVKSDV